MKRYRLIKDLPTFQTGDEFKKIEESEKYWYLNVYGGTMEAKYNYQKDTSRMNILKQIGNYFKSKKEAERAVEKMKAWKRLKDKGIRFELWDYNDGNYQDKIRTGRILFSVPDYKKLGGDLILLFGDEDE